MTAYSQADRIEAVPDHFVSDRLARRQLRNVKERLIELALFLAASVSVLTTIGIVVILLGESFTFFTHISLWKFLTDTQWTPLFADAHYGILPLLSGTLVSSGVALLVAIPLGTIIAIYLSEFAPFAVRDAAAPDGFPYAARVQPAVGGARDGHHDHSLRELAVGRRNARGADGAQGRLLRDGCDALPDRRLRRGSGRDVGDCRRLHPRG